MCSQPVVPQNLQVPRKRTWLCVLRIRSISVHPQWLSFVSYMDDAILHVQTGTIVKDFLEAIGDAGYAFSRNENFLLYWITGLTSARWFQAVVATQTLSTTSQHELQFLVRCSNTMIQSSTVGASAFSQLSACSCTQQTTCAFAVNVLNTRLIPNFHMQRLYVEFAVKWKESPTKVFTSNPKG